MKKIDIHAHATALGKEGNLLSPERLIQIYDDLGIEKGVILPLLSVFPNHNDHTKETARAIAEKYPHRFFWFTSPDLLHTDPASFNSILKADKERGAKGVGEITAKLMMDDPRVEALFQACGKNHLPLTFHIAADLNENYGVADEMGLPRLETMLSRYPETIVLGHAKPFWSEISTVTEETRRKGGKGPVEEGRVPELMRKYKNLYCDLSAKSGSCAIMRSESYGAKFLTEFQDRVLYGCDICSEKASYPKAFARHLTSLVETGLITKDVYDKITRRNALRLLGEK